MSIQSTPAQATANAVDVEDMLKDVKEAFGDDELYTSLKSAFSKVLANKGSVDPDSINKLVTNRLAAERSEERDSSLKYIVGDNDNPGRHPDFLKPRQNLSLLHGRKHYLLAKDHCFRNRKTLFMLLT